MEGVIEHVVLFVLGREAADRTIFRDKNEIPYESENVIAAYDQEALCAEARKDLDTTIYNISKAYQKMYQER